MLACGLETRMRVWRNLIMLTSESVRSMRQVAGKKWLACSVLDPMFDPWKHLWNLFWLWQVSQQWHSAHVTLSLVLVAIFKVLAKPSTSRRIADQHVAATVESVAGCIVGRGWLPYGCVSTNKAHQSNRGDTLRSAISFCLMLCCARLWLYLFLCQ